MKRVEEFGSKVFLVNTEEMINIELDTARNRLIKLEIMLTGCTFTFTIYGKSLCPSASRSRNGV